MCAVVELPLGDDWWNVPLSRTTFELTLQYAKIIDISSFCNTAFRPGLSQMKKTDALSQARHRRVSIRSLHS
jgi:hypothetical protein